MKPETLHVYLEPDPADAGSIRVRYERLFGGVVGEPRSASLADLEAIGLGPALGGDLNTLRSAFAPKPENLERGSALCRWLFGDAASQQRLFAGVHNRDVVAHECPIHLILHTRDPTLMSVPWRFMASEGRALVRVPWSIQLCTQGAERVELPAAPSILLVGPRYADDPIGTKAHIQVLKRKLEKWLPRAVIHEAPTYQDLRQALTKPWHVVYFYGHGSHDPATPGLQFPDRVLDPQTFATWLDGCDVHLLVLQCCDSGKQGYYGPAGAVRDKARAVVAHVCQIPNRTAQQAATRLLEQAVVQGRHPAWAANETPRAESFAWMTPVVFTSVAQDGWSRARPSRPLVPVADLDRSSQRSQVHEVVREDLLGYRTAYGVACVATGNADDAVEHLGQVVTKYLSLTGLPTIRRTVAPPHDPSEPRGWDDAVRAALEAPADDSIAQALRGVAHQRGALDQDLVVVLDFQAPDPPTRPDHWIAHCRRWAQGLHAERVRLICLLGCVLDADKHEQLMRHWGDHPALRPDHALRPVLLDRLAALPPNDLQTFLQRHHAALQLDPDLVTPVRDKAVATWGTPQDLPYRTIWDWLAEAPDLTAWVGGTGTTESTAATRAFDELFT